MATTLQYKFSKSGLRAISNPKQLLLEAIQTAPSQMLTAVADAPKPELVQELETCSQQLLQQQQHVLQLEQQLQKLHQRLQNSQRRCERQQEQLSAAEQRYQQLREQFHQTQRRQGDRQPSDRGGQRIDSPTPATAKGKREVLLPLTMALATQSWPAKEALAADASQPPVPAVLEVSTASLGASRRKSASSIDLPRFPGSPIAQ